MKKKLRLLLIGPAYPFRGGIAHYSSLLFNALRINNNVRFLALKRQFFNFLYPGRTQLEPGKEVIPIGEIERTLDTYNVFTWIRAGWIGRKYDAMLVPWWVTFWAPFYLVLFLIARLGKVKIVLICHNVIEHDPNLSTKLITKLVLRLGHAYIVQSEEQKSLLTTLLPKITTAQIILQPHPSYHALNSTRSNRQEARNLLQIHDETVLLFFGYVKPYKGVDLLIEAMSIIKTTHPNCRLYIVGEVWHNNPKYAQAIVDYDLGSHIVLIDEYLPLAQLEKYFLACDAVVLPYRSGTGSGVAQLGLGFGRPIIASDLPIFRETITENQNGFLFKTANTPSLVETISKFITRSDDSLRLYCEQEMKTDNSWSEYASNFEIWFNKLPARR